MTRKELLDNIRRKKSFLCVGLDTDIKKIPEHLKNDADAIFKFNKAIIDATAPYCVAYKPNLAFYECFGIEGWTALEKTIKYLKQNYPDSSSSPTQNAATSATPPQCMHEASSSILMLTPSP